LEDQFTKSKEQRKSWGKRGWGPRSVLKVQIKRTEIQQPLVNGDTPEGKMGIQVGEMRGGAKEDLWMGRIEIWDTGW